MKNLTVVCLTVLLFSCKNEILKDNAFTKIGELAVLSEKEFNPDQLKNLEFLQKPFEVLPQVEPIFDLRYISASELEINRYAKLHGSFFVVINQTTDKNLLELFQHEIGHTNTQTPRLIVAKNKWANNQLCIILLAANNQEIAQGIENNKNRILKLLKDNDELALYQSLFNKKELNYDTLALKGKKVLFPKTDFYQRVDHDGDFYWYRSDFDNVTQSILLKRIEPGNFNVKDLIELRNRTTQSISGSDSMTRMIINNKDMPVIVDTVDNLRVIFKGIWEIDKEFSGGPFISYIVHSKDKKDAFLIDGFVYAPGKRKRNFMLQVNYLINRIRFDP